MRRNPWALNRLTHRLADTFRRTRRPRKGQPLTPNMHQRTAELEPLEPRTMLSATVTTAIDPVALVEDGAPMVVTLGDHFDDPDITGTVVIFDTVPLPFDDDGNAATPPIVVQDWAVELFDDVVPQTVANFLNYVNDADYVNSIIHRLVRNFVVQGGGFNYDPATDTYGAVVSNDPVVNEFANWAMASGTDASVALDSAVIQLPVGSDLSLVQAGNRLRIIGLNDGVADPSDGVADDGVDQLDFFVITAVDDANDTVTVQTSQMVTLQTSQTDPTPIQVNVNTLPQVTQGGFDWFIVPDLNLRGTLSPPKIGGDPDSATNGFFINLANNASNLDVQNEGFAVFGHVLYNGMNTVDAIQQLALGDFRAIINQSVPSQPVAGAFSQLPVTDYTQADFNANVIPDETNLVLFNDIFVSPELIYQVVNISDPTLVTASVVGGELSIAPIANANGDAMITVRAIDLTGASVEQTFMVSVAAEDDPIVAGADEAETFVNTPVEINVLANDSDIDTPVDPTTVALVDAPDSGGVDIDPVTGKITYTPAAGVTGEITFTYTVANTDGMVSAPATVTVNILDAQSLGVATSSTKFVAAIAGVDVTLAVKGAGQVEVFQVGADQVDLVATGTDLTTQITISTKNGELNVRKITADGSVKAITGKTTNLAGTGPVSVAGTLGALTLNNVAGVHTLSIGAPTSSKDKVKITLNYVTELSITSATRIDSLTATDWQDNDAVADAVTAPSLGKLTLKGDRKEPTKPGDFEADLLLDGSDQQKQTLSSAKIAGSLFQSTWMITGDVGGIDVKGDVREADITVASDVKSIKGALFLNANLTFDTLGTLTSIDWAGGSLTATTVKSITIKGDRKTETPGDLQNVQVNITGDPAAKQVLSSAKIAGAASMGTSINAVGPVGSIEFKGDVTGLMITGVTDLKSFKGGSVVNTELTAETIGTVQVTDWNGGAINAKTAKTIQTKGDKKRDLDGKLDAVTVTLTGDPAAKSTLSNLKVAGPSTNATLDFTGDTGTIDIKGAVTGLDAQVHSELKTIKLGAVTTATLTADVVGTIQATSWLMGQINAATVKSLKTSGDKKTTDAGHLGVDIMLTGDAVDDSETALGSAKIAGDLIGGVWRVNGAGGAVSANAASVGVDIAFDGDLKSVTLKENSGGTFCGLSIGKVSVGGAITAGRYVAGIRFGPDNLWETADDLPLLGGSDAFIKSITVKGTTITTVIFTGGEFPKTASLDGQKVDPLTDERFSLTPA